MNGLGTRSALVREAERGLGVRHRPREARDIVSAINPIPQPRPQKVVAARADRREQRNENVIAAILAALIFVLFIVAGLFGGVQ